MGCIEWCIRIKVRLVYSVVGCVFRVYSAELPQRPCNCLRNFFHCEIGEALQSGASLEGLRIAHVRRLGGFLSFAATVCEVHRGTDLHRGEELHLIALLI